MKRNAKIKLIKSSFLHEKETKKKLAAFILRTEKFSMDKEVRDFEAAFSKKQGRAFSVMVNSGSSANLVLIQALLNLGTLKPGDKVGISALTWSTNIMPIIQLGLIPVPIDCEIDTLNVSPRTLEPHLSKLKALFITNVLGFSDDIVGIQKMCKKAKVLLLEDNCESLGSVVAGTKLGNFGTASTFSFFIGHHLSTIEGGMICTDDEKLYHMLLQVRAHGWDRNLPETRQQALRKKNKIDDFFALYTFYELAYNVRPSEINGFIGNIQLPYWDKIVTTRERNFKLFNKQIKRNSNLVPVAVEHMDVISNFAMPLICKDKKTFTKYLSAFKENGVEVRPIIAGDMTRQPFFKKSVTEEYACPNAAFIHEHAFYFGNNPELTKEELQTLTSLLQEA